MTGTGKYEMKTLDLREETPVDAEVAERLIREAIRLNRTWAIQRSANDA